MPSADLFPDTVEPDTIKDAQPYAVMVPLPLPGPLDYLSAEPLKPGDYVAVTVSGRETVGVVWGAGEGTAKKLKPVLRCLDLPPMPDEMRAFIDRSARYTLTPPGMMLRQATRAPGLLEPEKPRLVFVRGNETPHPLTDARQRVLDAVIASPGLSSSDLAREAGVSGSVVKGLVEAGALLPQSAPQDRPPPRLDPSHRIAKLSAEQREASDAIAGSVAAGKFETLLLEGITGSGKTETYLEAVAACIAEGRQALVLLPEIALTADFIRRMRERFGAPPVEWHSGVTPAMRRRAWKAVARGQAQVVAGARSALFLPFTDLALIVVDEEHDQSYKQDDIVHYQARDLSVLRASYEGATCVLASATPSLESWINAETGRYRLLTLKERHGNAVLPFLSAVDLRADPPEKGSWLSPVLVDAVTETLSRGEQALFFLNRRGYAPLTLCRKCGWRAGCGQCSAWLVEHRAQSVLLCHQCGWRERFPATCPDCGSEDTLAACGPGVERIAEEAAERFPLARIATLSSDQTPDPRVLQDQINSIAKGEADIIVGTQIVAKGHNFPLLTLVGVVDADLGLAGGDLRAAERTFQLLNQVAGRAGRAEKPGRAMLQTSQPDHPVLKAILDSDAERFRTRLAEERKQARMPPYARLLAVIVQGEDEEKVWAVARDLAAHAGLLTGAGVDVFGPAPAPFAMLRGKHRVRLLLRMPRNADHAALIPVWRDAVSIPSQVRVVFDVDPYSFL